MTRGARATAAAPEAAFVNRKPVLGMENVTGAYMELIIEAWDAEGDMPTGLIPNHGPFRGVR